MGQTTKVIITGSDLQELEGCRDVIAQLLKQNGVAQVEITFEALYKSLYDSIRSHVDSWHGVTVPNEEKDGVKILRFNWTVQTRKGAGMEALENSASDKELPLPQPSMMPRKQ